MAAHDKRLEDMTDVEQRDEAMLVAVEAFLMLNRAKTVSGKPELVATALDPWPERLLRSTFDICRRLKAEQFALAEELKRRGIELPAAPVETTS